MKEVSPTNESLMPLSHHRLVSPSTSRLLSISTELGYRVLSFNVLIVYTSHLGSIQISNCLLIV